MCDVYLQEVVRQVADRDLLPRLDGGGAVQQLPPPAPVLLSLQDIDTSELR